MNDTAQTDDELAHVERLLIAYEQAETDSTKQKAAMEQLRQQAAAWLISRSPRHLRDHQAAKNRDGTYNGRDLVQWYVSRELEQAKKDWERQNDNVKSATERQAEAKAVKLEEEAKGLQDTYVERETVRLEFMEMASAVRAELEALPKAMANDFPKDVRDDLIRELRNQIRQILRRLANRGARYGE